MGKQDELKKTTLKKEENWLDDLMERQEEDLKEEEEILGTVPTRFRQKWLDYEEE